MSAPLRPQSAEELGVLLADAARAKKTIELTGAGSKRRLGGSHRPADVTISTCALDKVLEYEPNDLTVSVEAGMGWAPFQKLLAANRQMVPLDPPWYDQATVGGVIASNTCGPRRRIYGSARDVVIGMKFATLEGKIIQSGGMVVKNVAGLDMGKLMIGSFGTLAAVASVNFKLAPMPPATRTFLMRFSQLDQAVARRDAIQRGVLQPVALDLLNPHAAARLGLEGWLLLLQAAGSDKVIARYTRELQDADTLDGDAEQSLWDAVREFVPHFLAEHERGAVVRVSTTLQKVAEVAAHAPAPLLCRAGNGVSYLCFPDAEGASAWLQQGIARGWRGVVESAPPFSCAPERQWPGVDTELAVMEKIKRMMDAQNLLNPGRLYGRI